MKRFTASDFTGEKPRIARCVRHFGDRVYTWSCQNPTSTGFGTTPKDAFNAWQRNETRRAAFYRGREARAAVFPQSLNHH